MTDESEESEATGDLGDLLDAAEELAEALEAGILLPTWIDEALARNRAHRDAFEADPNTRGV